MFGVRVHLLHLVTYHINAVLEVDRIPERLAHLALAVRAWEARDTRQKRPGHDQHGTVIDAIEAAHYFSGLFDHGELIRADRYQIGLEGGDVGRLADRITEEAGRNIPAKSPQVDLLF